MTDRVRAELELIRTRFPDVEFQEASHWARVRSYPVPGDWGVEHVEIAFRVPPGLPGEQPYGFWVRPPLTLPGGGNPTDATGPIETGFGSGWQQFSWAPEVWQPGAEPRQGTNMLDWVRSFADRLAEVN